MSSHDQLTHLGKSLSLTASTLLNPSQADDHSLTSNPQYKSILHEAVNKNEGGAGTLIRKMKDLNLPFQDKEQDKSGFQDLSLAKDGKSYFNNRYTDLRTSFKIMTHLNDEILNDIPSDVSKSTDNGRKTIKAAAENATDQGPSLFQGFEASIPIIDQLLTYDANDDDDDSGPLMLNTTEAEEKFLLPNGFTQELIGRSYSVNVLRDLSKQVTTQLDFLEVQKRLAENEINELDLKIAKLKIKRDNVFSKIATVEENEFFLQDSLGLVQDRLDFLVEYGLEASDDKTDEESTILGAGRKGAGSVSTGLGNEVSSTHPSKDGSKYLSADSNGDIADKLGQFYHNQNRNSRKITPTLQQYFEKGSMINTIQKAHDDNITCLDFDLPFGTLCTAGHLDHVIKIWDLSRSKQIGRMTGHVATVNCMQITNNMLVSGGKDALLKLWNLNVGVQSFRNVLPTNNSNLEPISSSASCIHTFDSHVDEITSVTVAGENLISGSQDRTIRQWDIPSGKCLQTIDLSFVAIASPPIQVTDSPFLTTTKATAIIGALQCFDAALATGTRDGIVRLWDLRAGKVVRALEGHSGSITCLKFDNKNIVTGSIDKTVRIWDLRSGILSDMLTFEKPVLSVDFDKNKIAIATHDEASL